MVVRAVGLVTPVADSFAGGGGQDGVSAESANAGDGAVFGDLDFEDYVAGTVGGQSFGRILGLGAVEDAGFGLRGREPDTLRGSEFRCRRCLNDRIAILMSGVGPGGIGLHLVWLDLVGLELVGLRRAGLG